MKITDKPILIIGKGGKTGRRVNDLLQQVGYVTRPVSRSSSPLFDWQQPQHWQQAMQGCEIAYVCYQPDLAVPEAQQAIREFVQQAKENGLKHLVLLSGRGEDGAQLAEQQLIESGLSWNVVRASWFAQNFSEGFLIEGILNGKVALPAGNIPEPFIDADDIAEVVVACLTRPELQNQLFEVTGPACLTFQGCISILSEELNRPIQFMSLSVNDFIQGMKQQGLPDDMIWLMNELFGSVMDGRNSYVCDGVNKALNRPPRSFRDYVIKAVNSGVWNPETLNL